MRQFRLGVVSVLTLALAIVFASGCGGEKKPETKPADAKPAAPAADPAKK